MLEARIWREEIWDARCTRTQRAKQVVMMEKVLGVDCGVWCCWWRNIDCDGEMVDSGEFETGEKVKRKFGSQAS